MCAGTYELTPQGPDLTSPLRSPSRYDNRITLHKLEVFCLVVELGGVSRAATNLWVAQSVVSGHLRSLQERLGVQVLHRDGQRMRLTRAGEEVYRWASEMLRETRELMRRLDDLDEVTSSSLTLAASLTTGSYLLPSVLAEFRATRPRAVLAMSVSDPERALGAVESGDSDLGIVIVHEGYEHPHMRYDVVGQEEIVLVAAPDGLPGVHTLRLAELSAVPLVAPFAGHIARESVDRRLGEYGVGPQNVVMELGHPEAMKRVVRNGTAACLLFRSCVEDELARGALREVPFSDATLCLPVLVVTRTDRRPPALLTELVEQTRVYLAQRARS